MLDPNTVSSVQFFLPISLTGDTSGLLLLFDKLFENLGKTNGNKSIFFFFL